MEWLHFMFSWRAGTVPFLYLVGGWRVITVPFPFRFRQAPLLRGHLSVKYKRLLPRRARLLLSAAAATCRACLVLRCCRIHCVLARPRAPTAARTPAASPAAPCTSCRTRGCGREPSLLLPPSACLLLAGCGRIEAPATELKSRASESKSRVQ